MADTKMAGGGSSDNDKVLAAVSALPLVGLIVYLAMKDASPFVKNYAKQGALVFLVGVVGMVVGFIPFIGWLISFAVWVVELVAIVLLLVNALQEVRDYKLPVLGDLADQVFK
ncbi:MAG TPA: DUF4870 domain-containing protein [Candidatus Dojkabacteria bacterium]|nr:DUF4870 domain-containing protein [Candidatus Dojkabacteria bacterium]